MLPLNLLMISLAGLGLITDAKPTLNWSDLIDRHSLNVDERDIDRVRPELQIELQLVVNYRLHQSTFLTQKPKRVEDAEALLRKENIDIQEYISQAEAMVRETSTSGRTINQKVIGKVQSIAGFIAPLSIEGLKVTEFLLVPTAGACVHTPPPPANQIIHVFYQDGISVSHLNDPFIIKGVLNGQHRDIDIQLSDGKLGIHSSYEMYAQAVMLMSTY